MSEEAGRQEEKARIAAGEIERVDPREVAWRNAAVAAAVYSEAEALDLWYEEHRHLDETGGLAEIYAEERRLIVEQGESLMDTRVSENEVFQSEFRLAAAYYAYKIAAQGVGFELTEDASHPVRELPPEVVPAAAPVRGRPPVPGMRGRNAPKPGEAGQFKEVGGHHIHAKSGFRGHPTYDPERGFSISEAYMARRGWEHPKMTAVQQKMFRELEKRGLPNTMRAHSRIAREALVKAGATRAEATALVRASLRQMRLDMVKAPTRIPWGKKGR